MGALLGMFGGGGGSSVNPSLTITPTATSGAGGGTAGGSFLSTDSGTSINAGGTGSFSLANILIIGAIGLVFFAILRS